MHREGHRGTGKGPLLAALPGRLFFSESVVCPGDLSAEQAGDLARLTVESRSPFPEDKLAVAYRYDRTAGRLLALATLKERIAPLISSDTPPAHVVPDSVLPLPDGVDGWRWILSESALTAVRYENGAPVAVRGFAVPESDDVAVILAARNHEAKRAGIPESGPVWRLVGVAPSRKPAGLRLKWEEVYEENFSDVAQDSSPAIGTKAGLESCATFISAADLDAADVRPASVVAELRRDAANERKLSLGFKALGAVAVLLLLAQIGIWSLHAVAGRRETALENNRPLAEAVEAKAALLDTLGKVTDRRTPQLEWMAALNEVRPDSVWLRRIAVDDKGVTAAGSARSMESLNGWLAALRKSKDFTEVTTPRITTAGQVVSFDLRVTSAKRRIQNKDTGR